MYFDNKNLPKANEHRSAVADRKNVINHNCMPVNRGQCTLLGCRMMCCLTTILTWVRLTLWWNRLLIKMHYLALFFVLLHIALRVQGSLHKTINPSKAPIRQDCVFFRLQNTAVHSVPHVLFSMQSTKHSSLDRLFSLYCFQFNSFQLRGAPRALF